MPTGELQPRTHQFSGAAGSFGHAAGAGDIAEQRLIDIRAGKTQTMPLEAVMKRYGVED